MMFTFQGKEHSDLAYKDKDHPFVMKFLWAPLMTFVEEKLLKTVIAETKASYVTDLDAKDKKPKTRVQVDYIILGIGLWSMQHGSLKDPKKSDDVLEKFKQGLPRIVQVTYSCHLNN